MSDNIKQMHRYGITPDMAAKVDQLGDAIDDALTKASDAGIPAAMVVYILEAAKLQIIMDGFAGIEEGN